MGHYSCLLITKDLDEVEKEMAYFNSNETDTALYDSEYDEEIGKGEIEAAARNVLNELMQADPSPENLADVVEAMGLIEKKKFAEVVERHNGGEVGPDGGWGYRYNANSFCDGWQVGLAWIRWRLKPGATGARYPKFRINMGASPPFSFSTHKTSRYSADVAQKKDIDFAATEAWMKMLLSRQKREWTRRHSDVSPDSFKYSGMAPCYIVENYGVCDCDGNEKVFQDYLAGVSDDRWLVLIDTHN